MALELDEVLVVLGGLTLYSINFFRVFFTGIALCHDKENNGRSENLINAIEDGKTIVQFRRKHDRTTLVCI